MKPAVMITLLVVFAIVATLLVVSFFSRGRHYEPSCVPNEWVTVVDSDLTLEDAQQFASDNYGTNTAVQEASGYYQITIGSNEKIVILHNGTKEEVRLGRGCE